MVSIVMLLFYRPIKDNCIPHTQGRYDCPPKIQLFRRQDLYSCCYKSLEQFAVRLMKSRLSILLVPAVAEDICHLDSPTTAHCELY